jgi:predicted esterase
VTPEKERRWRVLLLAGFVVALLFFGYGILASRGTFVPLRPAQEAGGSSVMVGVPGHRIAGRAYLTGIQSPDAPMVVVLHGDAPGNKPGYQYVFANHLAQALPGTPVVALLRPGYADPYGAKSDGDRGLALGENYTRGVIDDVAAAIQALKSQWNAQRVVLVGHSGGATIAADLAAVKPGLVQEIVLISCPCDVPAFRHHMAGLQKNPMWLLPVSSLSPQVTLDQMSKGVKVMAIAGKDDEIALPEYAFNYVVKANRLGISASMVTMGGKGHEILNEPFVMKQVVHEVSGRW